MVLSGLRQTLISLETQGQETKGKMMQKALVTFAVAASMGLGATAANAAILDDVKAKGYVQCGVPGGVPGFSTSWKASACNVS